MPKKSFFGFKNRQNVTLEPETVSPLKPEGKTENPKAKKKLFEELTQEAEKLLALEDELIQDIRYAKALFPEDDFSAMLHSWGIDFYDTGKTVEELNLQIAKVKEKNTELKAKRKVERAKAISILEDRLNSSLEKIEKEKSCYHLFDLERYRQFLTLVNSAAETEKSLRTGQRLCKETPKEATDWTALKAEANRLGKNKRVVEEATDKLLSQYLRADDQILNELQLALIRETLTASVLVVVKKTTKKTEQHAGFEAQVLEVEKGSNLYLVPALVLNQSPWNRSEEVVSVMGLEEEEIQTIITLYTSGSYPSLVEARDAAKAL